MRQTEEIVSIIEEVLKKDKPWYICREDIIDMAKIKQEEIYKIWRVIEVLEFKKIIEKIEGFLWKNNYN